MIKSANNFLEDIRAKAKDKTMVFVSGNFNLLHLGHLRLLEFAASCGDFLVVGVHDDRNDGVMFPQEDRLEGVRSLACVNYAFPMEGNLATWLGELRPDVVVKGKEHEGFTNVEEEILETYGGKVIFGSGNTHYSSVDILKKNFDSNKTSAIKKPSDFLDRHELLLSDLGAIVDRMKSLKVIVIGDTIIDDYITCDPLGLSQEDPTIVVTPVHTKRFIGGAGIVASHAAGLGASVKFFSVVGEDSESHFVRESLQANGVVAHLYRDLSRPTTLKQRYRSKDKTLLRVSHLRQHSISNELISEICEDFIREVDGTDLVVFSDFNYGCVPPKLVETISIVCHEKSIPVVADSQSSSQIGDITRFKNMKLVTPTEREARLGLGDFEAGLVILAEKLQKKANAENVYITLGADGLLIYAPDKTGNFFIDKLPSFNQNPKDTAGAGDSLLIASSLALAAGGSVWEGAYLGSISAAIQVSRVGNFPIQAEDLKKEIFR